MKKWSTVVACAAVALVAAGCGGSEEKKGGGGPVSGAQAVPQQPPGEVVGGKAVVDIKDLKFNPENVTIPEGGQIVFTNSDNVSHTVTKRSGPGPDFDSGPLDPGATFSQTLSQKGRVRVHDKSRPNIEMTITVEEEE